MGVLEPRILQHRARLQHACENSKRDTSHHIGSLEPWQTVEVPEDHHRRAATHTLYPGHELHSLLRLLASMEAAP